MLNCNTIASISYARLFAGNDSSSGSISARKSSSRLIQINVIFGCRAYHDPIKKVGSTNPKEVLEMTDVERFKSRLLSLKSDMTRRISAIQKDIRHEDLSADWSEQATERENDEVLDSLGNASEEELVMINKALERIDSGEYFCCVKCGGPIPEARLEVLPFSTRCVQCAE